MNNLLPKVLLQAEEIWDQCDFLDHTQFCMCATQILLEKQCQVTQRIN